MITVTPRSRSRGDRAGDPLDGLVNLFDLGIVLSVAFLLAALASLHLGGAITRHGLHATAIREITITPGQTLAPLPQAGRAYDRARRADRRRLPPGRRPAGLRPAGSQPEGALMAYLWEQLRAAFPLILSGNGYILAVTWVTIRVALVSTGCALVIGLPIGLALGLGRFRGRRALHILANASLALPPVLVGVAVLLLLLPQGVLGPLRIEFTLRGVYVAQTILALPYIVALTPAAIQGLPPGLLAQARALGAGRRQQSALALREAKIGVLAAVIAALASTLSEVAAVIIVGGNIENHDQTLASAVVSQINDFDNIPDALAIGIVLLALILLLIGALTLLQQRSGGVNLRFRTR